MTDDDGRLDLLLDQARPSVWIPVAALALALEGMLLAAAGLQSVLFLQLSGAWAVFPPLLLGSGVLSIVAAFALGRIVGVGGWLALLVSALSCLVAWGWLVACALSLVLAPGVLLAAAGAPIAFVLVVIALVPFRRCVRARKALARELEGGVPGTGGGMVAVAVLVGLLVIVGGLVLKSASTGSPMRVSVQLRGEIDPNADGRFASTFARALGDVGLTAVVETEPLDTDDTLDAARRRARKADAAHLVLLDLATRVEREGVIPGTRLHVVSCTAHFTTSADGVEATSETLEFAFEQATVGEIVSRVGDTWADALVPWVIEQLFASEAFAPVLEGDVELDQVTAALQLAGLENAVWDRRAMAQGYEDFCALERERLAALREGEVDPVRCMGDSCSQYTLIGVDQAGRAIVQDGSRRPLFKVPLTAINSWTEMPERIFAADLDRPEDEQDLLRSANFYDFGKLDLDGGFAAVETFGSNRAEAIYTVDLATGERRDVALLEPGERTAWILSAPGGDGALARVKGGPCLLVSAGKRVELPPFWRARWVRTGGGPRVLGQLEDGTAALYDLEGQPGSGRLTLQGALAGAFSSGEGELSLIDRASGECTLLRVDPTTLSVRERIPMPRCLSAPQMLGDGRMLGIAEVTREGDTPGDREVVLWSPGADELNQVTTGTHDEETVYPTPDGRRAVFNRRLEDWPAEYDTRTYRRQVCWVDLPPE